MTLPTKPISNVVQLLENAGFHFIGFDCLEDVIIFDQETDAEKILNWEIQSEPFICISHTPTGAWWIPPTCVYRLIEAKRLLWIGIRQDLELLEAAA
jgi:hypothetical protein